MATVIESGVDTKCTIKFTDINYTLVNAIRRALISLVPTYAFDTINIDKNSTNLDDDMLSHRISLIPVEAQLNITCDITNKTNDNMNIYSNDFVKSNDTWVCPNVLLTIVKPGQQLKFTASSTLGCGKTHAKWSCITYNYKQYERVFFNNKEITNDELIDVSTLDIKNLKTRLPSLFKDDFLLSNKILIDENLFNVINEIIGSEIIVRSEEPVYEIAIETINNFNAIKTYKSAITELYNECCTCKYDTIDDNSIKIYHDYSLVYMIVEKYRSRFEQYNISGIKVHPLDPFMIIKSNSPTFVQDLSQCLAYLQKELADLLQ